MDCETSERELAFSKLSPEEQQKYREDYWDDVKRRAKELLKWPPWKRGAEPAGP